jgi:hypothetical protein
MGLGVHHLLKAVMPIFVWGFTRDRYDQKCEMKHNLDTVAKLPVPTGHVLTLVIIWLKVEAD